MFKFGMRRSYQWQREQLIATGEQPPLDVSFNISADEFKALDVAFRRELLNRHGHLRNATLADAKGINAILFDGVPVPETLEQKQELLRSYWSQVDGERARLLATLRDQMQAWIDNPESRYAPPITRNDLDRLHADYHPDYAATLALYKQQQVVAAAKAAAEKQRAAESDAAANLVRAQRAADKRAWIAAHGSDYLKRACLDGGYDCQRRYVHERAALEFPGYAVDFDDQANWAARSCPSEFALAEAERVGGTVVWLTASPDATDDRFEPAEAVVVRDYLGAYDLVRVM